MLWIAVFRCWRKNEVLVIDSGTCPCWVPKTSLSAYTWFPRVVSRSSCLVGSFGSTWFPSSDASALFEKDWLTESRSWSRSMLTQEDKLPRLSSWPFECFMTAVKEPASRTLILASSSWSSKRGITWLRILFGQIFDIAVVGDNCIEDSSSWHQNKRVRTQWSTDDETRSVVIEVVTFRSDIKVQVSRWVNCKKGRYTKRNLKGSFCRVCEVISWSPFSRLEEFSSCSQFCSHRTHSLTLDVVLCLSFHADTLRESRSRTTDMRSSSLVSSTSFDRWRYTKHDESHSQWKYRVYTILHTENDSRWRSMSCVSLLASQVMFVERKRYHDSIPWIVHDSREIFSRIEEVFAIPFTWFHSLHSTHFPLTSFPFSLHSIHDDNRLIFLSQKECNNVEGREHNWFTMKLRWRDN